MFDSRSQLNPPDWGHVPVEQFRRLNEMLDKYDHDSTSQPVDRTPYLSTCENETELDMAVREMDVIDELNRNPPKFVGPYLIDQLIGEGGFGVVSFGFDPDGNPVAVKVPHKSQHIARTRDELDREAMTLRDLDHPNIVRYVDSGYDDTWYLVTEHINGFSLDEAARKIKAPVNQWVDIICQVCDALDFGHRQGVIHRDITLRNIMVTGEGKPIAKLMDYGIAKNFDDPGFSCHVRGTKTFLSPEQLQGRFDHRSDIYSLGIVMRLLLTVVCKNGLIPNDLRGIIRKATANDPAKRYQSANEMKVAIESADLLVASKPATAVSRWAMLAGAAALIGLAAFIVTRDDGDVDIVKRDDGRREVTTSRETLKPWNDFFDADGNAMISMVSEPPGATFDFYTLEHGEPRKQDRIRLGEQNIPPGDYFVVAEWPDGESACVLRRVPAPKTIGVVPRFTFDRIRRLDQSIALANVRLIVNSSAQSLSTGTSSFADAVDRLEKQGLRLPFYSELNGTGDIRFREWTSTFAASSTKEGKTLSGRRFAAEYSMYFVVGLNGKKESFPDYIPNEMRYRGTNARFSFDK